MPLWERKTWKSLFELFGPLDWKRQDFLIARVNQHQSIEKRPLDDFLLFRDPTEIMEDREEQILAKLGWDGRKAK